MSGVTIEVAGITMTQKPKPKKEQIQAWLEQKFSGAVINLAPISGGFWSAAYTFQLGEDELVLRFSDMLDGFKADQAAMRFASSSLPIPEVIEIGEALGHYFAISRRHYGRFLEDVSVEDADAAGGALINLLVGLRSSSSSPNESVLWFESDPPVGFTWHDFLRGGLRDNPDSIVSGWRETLATNKSVDVIFQACEARIAELLPYCPERRDLVHGDLLHQNVLISDDASCATAIFSWKCSVRGDFLYDVAWCTLWGPWHPGIAATNLWERTLDAPDLSSADLIDAPLRHHCYELQIAASHFGWNVWTKNDEDLAKVAAEAKKILERGPLIV